MRKFFYPKLAADTMKKNRRIYFPYIMTCILTVMMYYIISSLKSNPNLANIYGGTIIQEMMNLGSGIMSVFAVIFLFYTNSFLMKQRKREFGLYNILGMEKRHIARIIFYETLYILCISLLLGFVLGILLDKLMFLLLLNIFRVDVTLGFYVSPQAFWHTIRLFAVLFGLLLLNSLRQIYRSSPLELLKSRSVGEKPPRSKWLLTLVGFLFLGTGYYMSITIEDPVTALALFFVAVLLVILGTYCLFIAGGVTLLKALQKNKRYYYKTRHFIALSGMIYRMKQNAAGLANICILSTMVMVMVSSTVSMYASIDSQVAVMLPRDMTMTLRANDETDIRTALEEVRAVFEEKEETIAIRLPLCGEYTVETYKLNRETSAFHNWVKLGAPKYPTQEQIEYLKNASYTLSHARPTTTVRMEAITEKCIDAARKAIAVSKISICRTELSRFVSFRI